VLEFEVVEFREGKYALESYHKSSMAFFISSSVRHSLFNWFNISRHSFDVVPLE
jgi:hypothetical protein